MHGRRRCRTAPCPSTRPRRRRPPRPGTARACPCRQSAAAVVTFPAGPMVARPKLSVGPVPVALMVGPGHDDVAPRAPAAIAALDARSEIIVILVTISKPVASSAFVVITIEVRFGARITIAIRSRIVVHAVVEAPPRQRALHKFGHFSDSGRRRRDIGPTPFTTEASHALRGRRAD